jgi:hypothetical protein
MCVKQTRERAPGAGSGAPQLRTQNETHELDSTRSTDC